VAAVRAGDPAWARAVMTAHIHNARAVMVRAATEAAGAEPAAPPRNEEAS
jgi:DNA-binding FadR family transcriptional regulator